MRNVSVRLLLVIGALLIGTSALLATGTDSGRSIIEVDVAAGSYDIWANARGLDVVHMEGFATRGAPGAPQLPRKVLDVALPPGVDSDSIVVMATDIKTSALDGEYDIAPGAPLATYTPDGEHVVEWGDAGPVADGKDTAIYGNDAYFPASCVKMLRFSQMRKWKFARIEFTPLAYNPVKRSLRLIDRARLVVAYKSGVRASLVSLGDTVMDDLAKARFVNFDQASSWYDAGRTPLPMNGTYDYVIITTNDIATSSTALPDFVAHKTSEGYSVLVVTEDDYGGLTGQAPNGTAEKIRQWLIDNYASYGIEYVLLIGDPHPTTGDVPMKMCWPGGGYSAPTDYFYADLTGDWDDDGDQTYGEYPDDAGAGGIDLTAEVYVGRIPFYGSYGWLDWYLDAVMSYQTEADISWRKSILLPESFSDETTDGAYLAEHIMDDYLTAEGFSSCKLYEQGMCTDASIFTPDEELLHDATADRWASVPYGLVTWWGHGDSWSAEIGYGANYCGVLFDAVGCEDLWDAWGGEYLAIVYQCSCLNAYPENSDNLSYSLINYGAIAAVGATRVSWYEVGWDEPGGLLSNADLGYEMNKHLAQNSYPVGKALATAKSTLDPDVYWQLYMNAYDFNVYGDPQVHYEDQSNEDPVLSAGDVDPDSGTPATDFTYSVDYFDADGDTPATVKVYIDGDAGHAMALDSGDAWDGTYTYTTTLSGSPHTHDYYFDCDDGNGGSDRDPSSGTHSGPFVNTDPVLSGGDVDPDAGTTATVFMYSVHYYDADGDTPSTIKVYIDEGGGGFQAYDGPLGEDGGHEMALASGDAWDGTYTYTTTLSSSPHTHAYYFDCDDGYGGTDRAPGSGDFEGPLVNTDPVLSAGDVDPDSGTTATVFTYSIHYYDADGDTPATIKVYIDGDAGHDMALDPGNHSHDMALDSGDAWDGTYIYTTTLSASPHNHNFYFDCDDGYGGSDRDPSSGSHSGPFVNTDPVLSAGDVDPDSGTPATDFTYSVHYYDADGDTPSAIKVYIDGSSPASVDYGPLNAEGHDMALDSGDAWDGTYIYTTTLSASPHTHNYYFDCDDGYGGTDWEPSSGTHSGPFVNTDPVLSVGDVDPDSGTPATDFTFSIGYFDADGDSPSLLKVYIDGDGGHDLALDSGSAADGIYTYITTLTSSPHTHAFYFYCEDGYSGSDREPASGTHSGPFVNTGPVLSAGDVNPDSGSPDTDFTFSVHYYDADGDAPSLIKVYIAGNGDIPHDLALDSGSAADGTYTYTTKFPPGQHEHEFYFGCEDGYTGSDRDPGSGSHDGPFVNAQPVLSAGDVDPDSGTPTTDFTFSVHYYDADGDSPSLIKAYIDGDAGHDMALDSGTAADGTYAYTTTLSSSPHTHAFYFGCEDGYGGSDREPSSGSLDGPLVNVEPVLSAGDLAPASGSPDTDFTFSVHYFDVDGDSPSSIKAYIDGDAGHDMALDSGSAADGTYTFTTKFPSGPHEHEFYFGCDDGYGGSDREPDSGSYDGPFTNTEPALSIGDVDPDSGSPATDFAYSIHYYDADGDSPTLIRVFIDGDAGHDMSGSGADSTYTFAANFPPGQHEHEFCFECEDGYGGGDREPSSGSHDGPFVNSEPVLSSGDVDPDVGTTETDFTYSVHYFDADGDAPSAIRARIDGGASYDLALDSGSGADGTYTYTTLLLGGWPFYFECEDGQGGSDRDPGTGFYLGPVVHHHYYVDGEFGDDGTGDGTQSNPWRTITFALTQSNGWEYGPVTLHIAAGTYASSTNGETYPLEMESWVSLEGAGDGILVAAETILDAQGAYHVIRCDNVNNLTIDGFTITGGNATGFPDHREGGGICCNQSSPAILNSSIVENDAYFGGGISCNESSPVIQDTAIERNSAHYGGGMYCVFSSSPEFSNGTLVENEAILGGGICCYFYSSPEVLESDIMENKAMFGAGLCCYDYCSPEVSGSFITENEADHYGGGIYCTQSSPEIWNNAITENVARFGGGIFLRQSSPEISNNTLTENEARIGGGIYSYFDSWPVIFDSIIWGNIGDWDSCENLYGCSAIYSCVDVSHVDPTNIHVDPMFVAGPFGEYYLHPDSTCIDAGSRSAADAGLSDRTTQASAMLDSGVVDLGYHYPIVAQNSLPVAHIDSISPNPAAQGEDTIEFRGHDADNDGTVEAYEWRSSLDGYLSSEEDFDMAAGDLSVGTHVISFAVRDDDYAWSERDTEVLVIAVQSDLYVDGARGIDASSGLESSPFRTITHALSVANGSTDVPVVIHVARGTYAASTNGETFPLEMKGWVSLEGAGAADTILDAEGLAYHVIYCDSVSDLSIDGFTITGGNATKFPDHKEGGGIYCTGSSPAILNNIIAENEAYYGGGIYCGKSSPDIWNNVIEENEATFGGGIYCRQGSPDIWNNIIAGNSAAYGAAIRCFSSSSPEIANSTITGNGARLGGGILCDRNSSPTITDCIIWNNGDDLSGSADDPGESNIYRDPMFVKGPLGSYYLRHDSPCIDAGSRSAEDAGLSEMTTQPDGKPDAATVDVGYHYPRARERTILKILEG